MGAALQCRDCGAAAGGRRTHSGRKSPGRAWRRWHPFRTGRLGLSGMKHTGTNGSPWRDRVGGAGTPGDVLRRPERGIGDRERDLRPVESARERFRPINGRIQHVESGWAQKSGRKTPCGRARRHSPTGQPWQLERRLDRRPIPGQSGLPAQSRPRFRLAQTWGSSFRWRQRRCWCPAC